MAKELNQQEVTKRIGILIDNYPSARAFALKVGLDPGNLNKKRGGSQPWTINDVKKICSTINISQDWLIDGVGDMYVLQSGDVIQDNTQDIPDISDVLPNVPVNENKEYYLDIVMKLFGRYMDNEQRYQEIIKENQKIMQQITSIYNKIKKG